MYLQTTFYFSSILLTSLLTGGLAWYAWRQPALAGVRAYAILALIECLLALSEVISMLSGTQAQALVWFNLRYVFSALLPVIWLFFALAYQGYSGWFSKKVLAGFLVIPLITQIVIWTPGLQGWWVTQEVAFHKAGLFWIADVSVRIPGLWFMLHSFYSLALLLAGIIVILWTAWGIRREQRPQSYLLVAGGLVALVAALIPVFNLLPSDAFNPFIPGIGISALLYALAIFRFHFLKRAPVPEGAQRKPNRDPRETRSLMAFIFIFTLFAAGILAIGYVSYQRYQRQFRTQVEQQLTAIGQLKVNQLETWRMEREADAEVLANTPSFSNLVQHFQENPQDPQLQKDLQAWLDAVRKSYGYARVFLLDTQTVERAASPAGLEPVSVFTAEQAALAMKQGHVTFMDFHRDSPQGAIHLAIVAPIFTQDASVRPLGVVVLRVDPQAYLYPFIQEWPTPGSTAETLLVRQDGQQALFLNQLRFQPDAALNLRFPLSDTRLPAALAILGHQGVVEGLDYRGIPVVADIRSVPDSPWFLVSKIDTSEVYAPLRARLWEMILFYGALILASGTGLLLVWRQQGVRYYRSRLESMEALRNSSRQLKEAQSVAGLGDYRFDFSNGKWTSSEILDTIFGIDESFQRTFSGWAALISPVDRQQMSDYFTNEVVGKHMRFDKEYRIIRNADKIERWVHGLGELKFDQNNQPVSLVGTVQDITSCKRGEERIIQLASIVDSSEDAIIGKTLEGMVTSWNGGAERLYGYMAWESIGNSMARLFPGDRSDELTDILRRIRHGEAIQQYETVRVKKDGSRVDVSISVSPVKDASGKIIGASDITRDISRSKQAENIIRARLRLVEFSVDHSLAELLQQTLDEVCAICDSPIGFYHFVEPDQNTLSLQAWSTRTLQEYCQAEGTGSHYDLQDAGVWADSLRLRAPVIHNNYANLPNRKGLPEGHASLVRELVVPIFRKERVVAILGIGNRAQDYTEKDVGVVTYFADVAWEIAVRKRAEQELEAYSDHLEEMVDERTREFHDAQEKLIRQERLATLGQFAGSVAHELRNPLGVISNAAYFLKMTQPDANPTIQEYLDIIANETRNSDKIVSDLLDFTRDQFRPDGTFGCG